MLRSDPAASRHVCFDQIALPNADVSAPGRLPPDSVLAPLLKTALGRMGVAGGDAAVALGSSHAVLRCFVGTEESVRAALQEAAKRTVSYVQLGLGDRVAVLLRGRVAQIDPAETVFSRPGQVEVARFVGIETLIPGRVTEAASGLVQVDCGELQLVAEGDYEVGGEVWVSVRPEEIGVHDGASPAADDTRHVIAGEVTKTIPAETHYRVEIDCGARVVAVVNRARFREMTLEPGRRVWAAFPARAVHLIRRAGDLPSHSRSNPG